MRANELRIAILWQIVGHELAHAADDVLRVLPRHEARLVSLHAVWPASRLLPARLRACVDFLIEWFGAELPAWDRGVVAAADPA